MIFKCKFSPMDILKRDRSQLEGALLTKIRKKLSIEIMKIKDYNPLSKIRNHESISIELNGRGGENRLVLITESQQLSRKNNEMRKIIKIIINLDKNHP